MNIRQEKSIDLNYKTYKIVYDYCACNDINGVHYHAYEESAFRGTMGQDVGMMVGMFMDKIEELRAQVSGLEWKLKEISNIAS